MRPHPPRAGGSAGRATPHEDGSEVVSHVLVQAMVVLVVLMLLQVAFALHTRNLAISAAGEGARRGALLGGDAAEAAARTEDLLDQALGPGRPREVSAQRSSVGGRDTFVVTVSTSLPVLLTWGPGGTLTVRGRSVVEVPGEP